MPRPLSDEITQTTQTTQEADGATIGVMHAWFILGIIVYQSIYQSYSYTMYVEVIGSCIFLFTLCHSYPVCMLFGVAPYLIYIFNSWLQKFPRNQRGGRGLPWAPSV